MLTPSERESGGELREGGADESLLENPFRITPDDLRTIDRADKIVSFANRGRREEELQTVQIFWFDTAELPSSQVGSGTNYWMVNRSNGRTV